MRKCLCFKVGVVIIAEAVDVQGRAQIKAGDAIVAIRAGVGRAGSCKVGRDSVGLGSVELG